MRKLTLLIAFIILLCNNTLVLAVDSDKPLTEKDLEGLVVSKSQIEEILDFFSESFENKIPIDPEAAAIRFGYINFEDFAKQYLKLFKLTDISVEEIKEFLEGTDESVIIDQSQENLDKLYSLIINDKYLKKKTGYFKKFKKGKHKGNQINKMNLAVYINYEKEMAKITKNPNLEKISRFAFWYSYAWGSGYNIRGHAIDGCEKDAKKHKLFGGKCVIVDWRNPETGEIKNMLYPSVELAKRMEEKKKQKSVTKLKKKAIDKTKDEDLVMKANLSVPVEVFLMDFKKLNFKSKITMDDVKKDFQIANKIWNKKGFDFKILNINKIKGKSENLKKDLKWIDDNYIKSLRIDRKEQKVKAKNQQKYNRILFKLINYKKNRNKNAINVFYIPYIPNKLACGVAYSYALNDRVSSEIYQLRRQNHGFVIMGEKSQCKSRGRTLAHELGHMFSLKHKHDQKTDLMMWGNGIEVQNWQINKFIKYHDTYLKNRFVQN